MLGPIFVKAGAPVGDPCATNTDCATGLFCDLKNGNVCETVTNTTPCVTSTDCQTSRSGLVCNSGTCGQPANNDPNKYPIGKPLNGGSCGNYDVQIIQGIVKVAVDGVCGTDTITAIQKWQQSHFLTDDGIVGSDTASAMGLTTILPSGGGGSSATSGGSCPTGLVKDTSSGLCLPPKDAACNGGICESKSFTDLLIRIITLLLTVAGIIAVLMLIVGGFWYITSAGNEEQSEKGKKAITNAIIGVIVVLLSYAIVTVIGSLVNTGK